MSGALFAGWRPDAAERDVLSRLVSGMEGVRPSGAPRPRLRRPDQWHVTLCFIGHDLPETVVAEARRVLAEAATPVAPHTWRLERVDYWPGSGAVVALPEPDPALQALCDACASALDGAGIPVRATTEPHLTLAFLPRHLPPQAWLADVHCERATMRVDGFELLRNAGGRYEALAAWPLARPA